MNTTSTTGSTAQIRDALSATDSSVRLRAALAAGTDPAGDLVDTLVGRCAVEPDFYVRDMLTWALTRHPVDAVLTRLRPELRSHLPRARGQALHTLSKIGAPETWGWITPELFDDPDHEVVRSAWRAAVALVPDGEVSALAGRLIGRLGSGDPEMRRSLSRALVALGETVRPLLVVVTEGADEDAAVHAHATMSLMDSPDLGFDAALHEARRTAALGGGAP